MKVKIEKLLQEYDTYLNIAEVRMGTPTRDELEESVIEEMIEQFRANDMPLRFQYPHLFFEGGSLFGKQYGNFSPDELDYDELFDLKADLARLDFDIASLESRERSELLTIVEELSTNLRCVYPGLHRFLGKNNVFADYRLEDFESAKEVLDALEMILKHR